MKATLFLLLMVTLNVLAVPDSARLSQRKPLAKTKLTIRMHSLGYFSYTGRIISDNPAADLHFNYERKNWGFLVFKAMDLYDHRTANNFTLALGYRNFHIGKRLVITPYAGAALEQCRQVADRGSDVTFILTTTLKLNKKLSIDNSTLFSNLVLEPQTRDWVNRFRILYSRDHVDLTLLAWHNNKVFDTAGYFSGGFNAAYSRIKVSDRMNLSTGLTGLVMIQSSDQRSCPKKNGLLFTVAALFH
jgi:hypothetical protein